MFRFCCITSSVRLNIGEPFLLPKLMPKSKKSVPRFKNAMKSHFWKLVQMKTTFIRPLQSVPLYSPKELVQIIKSITAREIFKSCPKVKQYLWGGKFWSEGYFVSTVGTHQTEKMIKNYVQQQGKPEDDGQLRLF